MAKLLFSLRGVPDDEVAEVRDLLARHNVDYYETPAGKWGISAPGVWLKDVDRYDEVRALLDTYQKKRFTSQRDEYEQLKNQGKHRTMFDTLKEDPVRFFVYLLIVGVILYFSIAPFLNLAKD